MPQSQGPSPEFQTSEADTKFVKHLKEGQDAAFNQLVAMMGERLLRLCRKMLSNEDDALEAVQDTFVQTLAGLKTFDGRSQVSTWMHRIAVNNCLMKLRTRRRKTMASLDAILPQFQPDGHHLNREKSWRPIPEPSIERGELLDLVRSKIDELPDDYRTVIILRDVLEYDTAEVCSILDLGPSAVKTRLHRARQALKELISPNLEGWPESERTSYGT